MTSCNSKAEWCILVVNSYTKANVSPQEHVSMTQNRTLLRMTDHESMHQEQSIISRDKHTKRYNSCSLTDWYHPHIFELYTRNQIDHELFDWANSQIRTYAILFSFFPILMHPPCLRFIRIILYLILRHSNRFHSLSWPHILGYSLFDLGLSGINR